MKKIIDRIVMSPDAPGTYDLWIDTANNKLKVFVDGKWKDVDCSGKSGSQIQ